MEVSELKKIKFSENIVQIYTDETNPLCIPRCVFTSEEIDKVINGNWQSCKLSVEFITYKFTKYESYIQIKIYNPSGTMSGVILQHASLQIFIYGFNQYFKYKKLIKYELLGGKDVCISKFGNTNLICPLSNSTKIIKCKYNADVVKNDSAKTTNFYYNDAKYPLNFWHTYNERDIMDIKERLMPMECIININQKYKFTIHCNKHKKCFKDGEDTTINTKHAKLIQSNGLITIKILQNGINVSIELDTHYSNMLRKNGCIHL